MIAAAGRRGVNMPIRQASTGLSRALSYHLLRLQAATSPLSSKHPYLLSSRWSHHPSFDQDDSLSSRSQQQKRQLHVSREKASTLAEMPQSELAKPPRTGLSNAPLSVLPFSMILRSLATTTISSSPLLLPPSLRIMMLLANSTSSLLNPDKNPVLRFFLKKTFYAQFCAGEDPAEVRRSIARLKNIGFTGVIMGYAREVVLSKDQAQDLDGSDAGQETAQDITNEIEPWLQGTMETVRLAEPGDYVALKFTGAGRLALFQLQHRRPPSPYLSQSIDSICQLAQERGVRLLFDAEQDVLQDGIDDWTMQFARKYNTSFDSATVYGTYQAYKKKTPSVLSAHLAEAQLGNFTIGVKLVRGAYLGSDPRECFHDTKEQTDACYNEIAASILTRQWNDRVSGKGHYPAVHIVLATHNAESVRQARAICEAGRAQSGVAFAQLQGMADEVSCELVTASRAAQAQAQEKAQAQAKAQDAGAATALPVYKYLVWGTTGECMKYLLRRAQENKDAVQRTRDGRNAMWSELVRRSKRTIGLGR